ncbi:MAG: COX15/CtaA family protein [Neptuniibacter sp.]
MDIKMVGRAVKLAIVLSLCVVLLGAWTRINDAGLSCPDWPGCYGHMVLPSDPEALNKAQTIYPEVLLERSKTNLEMWHRYLAGGLGLVIAFIAYIAVRLRKVEGFPVTLCLGLFVLVIIQALFGMWTVTLKLYPPVVTLHLLGGVLTLTVLLFIHVRLKAIRDQYCKYQPQAQAGLVRTAILVLLLQIVLGGWTSSNYAGPACSHWLSCNPDVQIQPDFKQGFNPAAVIGPNYQGGLLPVEARSAIQIGHRLGALVVVLVGVFLVVRLMRESAVLKPLMCFVFLMFAQLILGALNAVYAVPALLAMLHHAIAIGLLLSLLWVYSNLKKVKGENHE